MQKNVIYRWIKRNFLQHISLISITACCLLILGYKINSTNLGPNVYEITALARLSDLSGLLQNPTDFTYFSVAKLFSFLISDLTALRIASAIFALATIFYIRFLLKYLVDTRTSNIGTLIALPSFWLLVNARIGAPHIMSAFWVSLLLAVLAWRTYAKKTKLSNTALVAVITLGLYSPVFIWIVIGLLGIYLKKDRLYLISKIKNFYTPALLIALLPLIYSVIRSPEIVKDLLGLKSLISSPLEYLSSLISNFSQIFIRGGIDNSISLGRQPFLDFFQAFMLIIGVISILTNKSFRGTKILWLPLVLIAFTSIGGSNIIAMVAIMPIVLVLIAIGFNDFLNLWLKNFPKNPFGRSLGLFLCLILLAMSSYYNIHKYYIAWSKNPDVQSAHNLRQ